MCNLLDKYLCHEECGISKIPKNKVIGRISLESLKLTIAWNYKIVKLSN